MIGIEFIDYIFLPVHDQKIIDMLQHFNAPMPLIDKGFKEDGGNSMELNDYGIELFFGDACSFDDTETVDKYENGTIIFGGVDFKSNTKLTLPFGLEMKDDLETVINKLGRKPNYVNKRLPQKVWMFERGDNKQMLIYVYFRRDYSQISSISLSEYTTQVEYLQKNID